MREGRKERVGARRDIWREGWVSGKPIYTLRKATCLFSIRY